MSLTAATSVLAARPPGSPPSLGVVARFDDAAGVGEVDIDGVGAVAFHCTAIADGSRTIVVGTPVTCCLAPAHLGGVEAVGVVALGE